jgi:hypothetical protein
METGDMTILLLGPAVWLLIIIGYIRLFRYAGGDN